MPSEGLNRSGRGSAALAETKDLPLDRVNGTPVDVDGEAIIVGKLSISQLTALAREVLSASLRMTPEERTRLLSMKGDEADIAVLLYVLDAGTIARIFSIALDREEEWCATRIDAVAALEIVDAVLEHNSWERLSALFLRLRRHFQRSRTNSPSPSPSSPDSGSANGTSESTPSSGSSEPPQNSAEVAASTSPTN